MQGLVLFKVRLDYPEPIKRNLAVVFGETGKLVHTRRVRQIMLTDLCHLMLKVTTKITGGIPFPSTFVCDNVLYHSLRWIAHFDTLPAESGVNGGLL